jgi:hypothetical protein
METEKKEDTLEEDKKHRKLMEESAKKMNEDSHEEGT